MHLFLERRAWAAPRLGSLAPAGRRLRAVPRPPHGVLPPSAADVRAEAHRTSAIMLLLQVVLLWSLSCITGAQQQAAADSHGDDATTHRELSLEALEAMPVNFSSGHRIVGGLEASPGQFPYQVGIFIEKGPIIKRGTSFCGGSILSERIVMTAAHCTPRDTLKITVYAGALSIRRDESPKITVDAFYAHERFSKDLLNDIALLHLSSRLEFNDRIQPINLPPKDVGPLAGLKVVMSGWGRTSTRRRRAIARASLRRVNRLDESNLPGALRPVRTHRRIPPVRVWLVHEGDMHGGLRRATHDQEGRQNHGSRYRLLRDQVQL
ncbi:coagulation factor IX-like isoform X3 [Frankliniella occidentalis]|uniref:Coagulation factor IX-like isoform X3 n=1 Tax=Frankliniella occidentalis TaxID=133901 RepID=A0A6J1TFK8_FRAOC|nr:coagulation factor IX-like isoform X3 [Frankliniella occidentalis]